MLKLECYGSSSKGNCFVLSDNDGEKIMIDCGVRNVADKLDISTLEGVLISHEHLDHCRDVRNLKNYYNYQFYGNKETIDKLPVIDAQKTILEEKQKYDIGCFTIIPFSVYHDVPNFGYLIKHNPSNMKILYIIDTSSVSNLHFKDVDVFIIEANHSYEWLEEKEELDFTDYRTYGEQGHLAVEDTIEFLFNSININTKKVILTHISTKCDNYIEMKEKVEKAIANPNIEVIAINPHSTEKVEVLLKEDLNISFD